MLIKLIFHHHQIDPEVLGRIGDSTDSEGSVSKADLLQVKRPKDKNTKKDGRIALMDDSQDGFLLRQLATPACGGIAWMLGAQPKYRVIFFTGAPLKVLSTEKLI